MLSPSTSIKICSFQEKQENSAVEAVTQSSSVIVTVFTKSIRLKKILELLAEYDTMGSL